MASRFKRDPRDPSPAVEEALRLYKLPRRKPTDADRPPLRPWAGPKIKPLPGQLQIEELSGEEWHRFHSEAQSELDRQA